jgi:hypothetical protein
MPVQPTRGVRRLALALAAGGIAFAASAQYRIPDLKPPPPRIAPAPPPGEKCESCGRIAAIREVTTTGNLPAATVAPVPGGGDAASDPTRQNLIGAVIYLPLGGERTDKPYIGGVGTPEMYARLRETTYQITLRMDDGTFRFVRRPDGSSFGVGDRVRWLGGDELELLAN